MPPASRRTEAKPSTIDMMSWDGRDPDGGNAHEADEHGETARESREGGGCRH